MTDRLLCIIKEKYPVLELDTGEFATLKANGMKFSLKAYKAQGLGHVSVMRASGFFGLMRMDTFIINPSEIDLPLYSYDRIYAAGNDTLIVELYDTMITQLSLEGISRIKEKYEQLPERDPGVHWYDPIKLSQSVSKKGKRSDTQMLDSLSSEHFNEYLSAAQDTDHDTEAKRQKTLVYVNGLLEHGGPSTDAFKKSLGNERTDRLFREYLFGCGK